MEIELKQLVSILALTVLGFASAKAQTLDAVTENGNTTNKSIFLNGNAKYNIGNYIGESLYFLNGVSYLESGNPSTNVLAPLVLKSSLLSINSRANINNATDDGVSALLVNGKLRLGNTTLSGDIQMDGKTGATLESRLSEFANTGIAAVNAGDLHLTNYWGVAIDINKGMAGDNSLANAAVIPGSSSFTINSYQGATSLNTLFTVRYNGNVGIGITNPTSKFMVQDASGSVTAGAHIVASFLRSIGGAGRGVILGYYSDGTNETAAVIRGSNNADLLLEPNGGNVGIGTATTGTYKLAVEGTIGARKVKVTQAAWADFVFDPAYQLPSLHELESYITANKHLPDVPSAVEIIKDGQDLGEMNKILLQKIEELTLYMIEMKKENEEQKARVNQLMDLIKGQQETSKK